MVFKNKYKIIFTEDAFNDLDNIYSYIKQQLSAQKAAFEQVLRIEKAINNLSLYPFSAKLVLDEILQEKGYRKLVVDNYLVFYLVNEHKQQVILVRILYGAQKYDCFL